MSANPSTLDILDAVIADRTNLSGVWIADGIAAYRRPRDVAVQSPQLDIDDTTPAQSLHGQIDAQQSYTQDEILEIIAGYERMYNMTTVEFSRKYHDMPDTYETNDWRMLANALGILPASEVTPVDAGNGHRSASANVSGGGGNGSQRTSNRTKSRTARRTRNATQKVLDYLSEHPSDTALSTDTLLLKLSKARIKVGRSSVGKALGIARVNGHS